MSPKGVSPIIVLIFSNFEKILQKFPFVYPFLFYIHYHIKVFGVFFFLQHVPTHMSMPSTDEHMYIVRTYIYKFCTVIWRHVDILYDANLKNVTFIFIKIIDSRRVFESVFVHFMCMVRIDQPPKTTSLLFRGKCVWRYII